MLNTVLLFQLSEENSNAIRELPVECFSCGALNQAHHILKTRQIAVCMIPDDLAMDDFEDLVHLLNRMEYHAPLLIACRSTGRLPDFYRDERLFDFIGSYAREEMEKQIQQAMETYDLLCYQEHLSESVESLRRDQERLCKIGASLSSELNLNRLLEMILRQCRKITGSDSGSLYLVEEQENGAKKLRFRCAQNDSKEITFQEFLLDIDDRSIAGYVAKTGSVMNIDDVYHLPKRSPFQFDKNFDKKSSYRTKSMLVAPMKNRKGKVIGVVQLINRKRDFMDILDRPSDVEQNVVSFTEKHQKTVLGVAGQAAAAVENAQLYQQIENLLLGIVQSIAYAIDMRDPTTSGHSQRVATYTMSIAEKINESKTGVFKDIHFNAAKMKELHYAAILHDVGKIGVREFVLMKKHKLPDDRRLAIVSRLRCLADELKTQAIERGQDEPKEEIAEIMDALELVDRLNQSGYAPESDIQALRKKAATLKLPKGPPCIEEEDLTYLSVQRGNFTEAERMQMMSHINHTWEILSRIPWTEDIREVPRIAGGHHERLDGTGYWQGLKDEEIHIGSKILAIIDIYEALTARDRPYKPPMPIEKALGILQYECEQNHLDKNIVDLFVEEELYKSVDLSQISKLLQEKASRNLV